MGGGDKCLIDFGGRPLLAHAVARICQQASELLLNANGDPARFAKFGLPVQADALTGYLGPLAGILAGMRWAAALGARHVVSLPTDTPFFPNDLVDRLIGGETPSQPIVMGFSAGIVHPVFALWPTVLAERLEEALLLSEHSVDRFARSQGRATVEWPVTSFDPFFNINTRKDLDRARRILASTTT